jgi:glucose/arabinose dehydrogenase
MHKLITSVLAAFAATSLHGALAELNVTDGTIESPDGVFVGRDFTLAKDFKMELLYNVPAAEGQWVTAAWDDKGRLMVSGYDTDVMNRLTIPAVGSDAPVGVEHVTTTQVGAAEGLLHAFGGLYMNVNRSTTMTHGLYRLTDTNGDDKYDRTDVIRNFSGSGDHGTHALRLSPDKQSIFLINGNSTRPTVFQTSRVPKIWGEDTLTMRIQTGFMNSSFGDNTVEAYVTRFDKDGKSFELFAMGMRNPVDFAFNKDGELFTYDSDMEWDMGDPWYRPTNIAHITSGADFGFRNGSRKHPQWQFDFMPHIAEVGSGSPVGTTFGTGAKFPARYQDALFSADWSYGNLYSVYIDPQGASYTGNVQAFITGRPFAVTGLIVNPKDGSLLVMTGGRAQTQLYRITYTGAEPTAPSKPDTRFAAERDTRHRLEQYHGKATAGAVDAIWPYLGDADRSIRYAARVALEWQDPAQWKERALLEPNPRASMSALVALSRVSGKDIYARKPDSPAPDRQLLGRILTSLDRIDVTQLTFQEKLDLLRSYSLALIRLGEPDAATRARLIAKFDPMLPGEQRELNWELADMLAYLDAPSAPAKLMALLRNAPAATSYYGTKEWINPELRVRNNPGRTGPAGMSNAALAKQEDQIYYAQLLRVVKNGWTAPLREEYVKWFIQAGADYRGGNEFASSNAIIRADAISQIPASDITPALKALIDTPITAGGGRAGGGGGGGGAAAPAGRGN